MLLLFLLVQWPLSLLLVKLGPEFYLTVDLISCEKLGLHIDADTVLWWMEQSNETRAAIVDEDARTIQSALLALSAFADNHLSECVWGNGSDFDNIVLASAYAACDFNPFWRFYNNRDVRTIEELGRNAGIDPKKTLAFEGEQHNELTDAIHQAKYVSIIHQHLIKPVNDDI
ncbi:hypothetical protein M2263_000475 [Providencia alcalifaciens]|nr:hypothetical protein [Providencia alcalifaciens]